MATIGDVPIGGVFKLNEFPWMRIGMTTMVPVNSKGQQVGRSETLDPFEEIDSED